MQAEQQSERERFEAWFEHDYMAGLDGPGEWDAERNCYVQLPVHMAWCAYRAALSHPSPQGWKLVPVEPTTEMKSAMAECDGWLPGDRDRPGLTRWEDYWRVAIAASPPPEQGSKG